MTRRTIYIVVSWADQQLRDRARSPRTREYGSASTKQAAIRLAERVQAPDAEYIIATIHRTVHEGRTPKVPVEADHRQRPTGRTR